TCKLFCLNLQRVFGSRFRHRHFIFTPAIKNKHLKVYALPELQETSDLPCDTGSDVRVLESEFKGQPVDLSYMYTPQAKAWNNKTGKWGATASAVDDRARIAREWLYNRPEKEIVVVTHGGFLHYFTEDWMDTHKMDGTPSAGNPPLHSHRHRRRSDAPPPPPDSITSLRHIRSQSESGSGSDAYSSHHDHHHHHHHQFSRDTATNGWKTDYIIAMLIVGAALIVAFVFWELYYPHPLVPMSIWRDKNFSLVMIVLLFGMMAFSVAEFFLALYMQEVWKWSPLTTAVHLLPMAIMGIIVNIVAGMIMHRVSNKALMLVGCFGYTIAFTLIAVNTIHSSYWAFCFPSFLLAVVGADLEFNVANYIVQTVTKLCQSVGFGIGTAVFNAVGRSAKEGGRWDVATKPYSAVFWFAAAASGTSIVFATFLTIGTQGGKEKGEDEDEGEGSGEAKQ
ncbi:putative transporter, partial [Aureobasidium pullulans]